MPSSIEKILSSDRLPSLPEVALRVVEIARSPDPDFMDLVETIRMDPAIAGRILKTANSALLGMRTRASSIESAVPRLGTTMVRALVLGFCLADSQKSKSVTLRTWYQRLWREALIQAATAEALAERQKGQVDPANWFLAGLLQDVGRLAMLSVCQDEYIENVLEKQGERAVLELEQEYFGFTHADVSAALCKKWNLDDSIVHAIGAHHADAHRMVPLRFVSGTSLVAGLITSGHIAEYLEEVSHNLGRSRQNFERLLLQVFALQANEVFRLLADIDSRVGEIAAAFSVDIGHTQPLESILADAQEVLSQIAVSSQLRLVNAHMQTDTQQPVKARPAGQESAQQAEQSRWTDPQSQTFSRQYLDQSLTATLQNVHDQRLPLGLLLIGMNDTLGDCTDPAGTGCEVLRSVANTLKMSVRVSDTVGRFSPGEFLVLMTDINVDMLHLVADHLYRRIEREAVREEHSADAPLCSIGAVFYQPDVSRPCTGPVLIKEVEKALQSARRSGQHNTEVIALENGKPVKLQFSKSTAERSVPESVGNAL